MSPLTRLLSFAALAIILKASAGPSLGESPASASRAKPPASTLKASTKPPGTAAGSWASDPMYAAALDPTPLATGSTLDQVDSSYASPVPEEPTALMLVAGLGVLTVMVWKRRAPAHD